MASSESYRIEDLIQESESTLQQLSQIELDIETEHDALDQEISKSNESKFKDSTEEIDDYRADGYVEYHISGDKMYLTGDFYPATEGMAPISYDYALVQLAELGCVFGIDDRKLRETVFKCNTEGVPFRGILIGEGRRPEDEIPEHWILKERFIPGESDPSDMENIDYKDISPFIMVEKGEGLAEMVPRKDGIIGKNLYGDEFPFRQKKVDRYSAGKNTEISGEQIISVCNGRFELSGTTIAVNEILEIKNDVDYHTGNINFPGDIVVGGSIKDGFKIESGGSLFTMKTLDASEIVCKKDLNVKLGIIGRKKATVKIGGTIKAKFIENCYVEAEDNIYLEAGALNSTIYTSGIFNSGRKGVIIGGSIYAQNGVKAVQIGSRMGPRTEIYCGMDFHVSNKLEWIKDNTTKIAVKLEKVEYEIRKSETPKPELIAVRDKLQQSLLKLNEVAAALVYKLDKNDNAEVEVLGTVYPGVYVEICHISYVVSREMNNVRFRLDKGQGAVKVV